MTSVNKHLTRRERMGVIAIIGTVIVVMGGMYACERYVECSDDAVRISYPVVDSISANSEDNGKERKKKKKKDGDRKGKPSKMNPVQERGWTQEDQTKDPFDKATEQGS